VKTLQKPPKGGVPKRATRAKTPKTAQAPAPGKKTVGRSVPLRRVDFGAPIDGFFAKQPPHLRVILEALRKLIEDVAPDATASLKWGTPVYAVGRDMMCALAGFKSHVNLILAGPPGTFMDPEGLLEGEGKTGRHLKLRTLDELPLKAARGWLRAAAQVARTKAAGK
jgi:hypothetical protein